MGLRIASSVCATVVSVLTLASACAGPSAPEAPVVPAPFVYPQGPINPPPPAPPPAPPAQATTCGPQPEPPRVTVEPTCSAFTLRSGQSFHDQLTVQLSSGATTRLDCPRMRFHGQDAPVCVAKVVGGRMRGACCPPGHTDPTDPECVAEGSVDEMFKRQKIWEWCSKTTPQSRPCEPCVWVTGAER